MMRRFKLEIHPRGDSGRARTLVEVDIANVTEYGEVCDYMFEARFDGSYKKRLWRGKVRGHHRPEGALALATRVLDLLGLETAAEEDR